MRREMTREEKRCVSVLAEKEESQGVSGRAEDLSAGMGLMLIREELGAGGG
jgi:pyruvate kinase